VSLKKRIKQRTKRRQLRVRFKLQNPSNLLRVSDFRSLNYIYAQLIDDANNQTLLSCSSLELKKLSGTKSEIAKAVGHELAKRALQKGVSKVIFDRGSYLFHGRVKSLAEGLREGGLQV
jgi:large subunit ribosomal protein L18